MNSNLEWSNILGREYFLLPILFFLAIPSQVAIEGCLPLSVKPASISMAALIHQLR